MKRRIVTLSLFYGGMLAFALVYLLVFHLTGYGLVCPFRLIFSLECPGCGITHALVALLRLDLRAMLEANLLSPLIISYILFFAIRSGITYLKTGRWYSSEKNGILDILFLVLVLVYGVLRNTSALDGILAVW